jgi:ACS family tartrate transporter-like MFS transporter
MTSTDTRARVNRKVARRLIPFLGLLYLVNYLDRTNLSIAGPNGMTEELGLTAAAFGLASGIFFAGYLLLEVPSNLALHRFGARRWLARIVVSWGLVASAMAFVPNEEWLYGLRVLLGMAEAGFAPGVLLYLTYWFSTRVRAQAIAGFLLAIPLSSVIGAPFMSWLVTASDGWLGLSGWRVIILVTGLPAIMLGVVCWFYLTDRPSDASWLTEDEKATLEASLAEDEPIVNGHKNLKDVLTNGRVWLLAFVLFCVLYGIYTLGFFLPTMITGFQEQFGVKYSPLQVGMLTAVPYGLAAISMYLTAKYADRSGHIARTASIAAVVGAVGIVLATTADSPYMVLAAVSVGTVGLLSALSTFYALPTRLFVGAAGAAAIAFINTAGNMGSFVGPYLTGWLKDLSGGSTQSALLVVGGLLVLAAVVLSVKFRRIDGSRTQHGTEQEEPSPV